MHPWSMSFHPHVYVGLCGFLKFATCFKVAKYCRLFGSDLVISDTLLQHWYTKPIQRNDILYAGMTKMV